MTSGAALAPRLPYGLVALLTAALLINYVDRGSVSIAAPLLQKELQLTAGQLGWVLSGFFWAYVVAQPLMGWLADRLGAARVLAGGFALWSVATLFSGLSGGIVGLVLLRLLMGVGESVTYPSALALLAQRVEDRHRARATGVFQLGGVLGPAVGAFVGGLVMVHYGWRAMFVTLGLASLLWIIPWSRQLRAAPSVAAIAAARATTAPTFSDILRQRALWSTMLGNFCSNYAFYFVFTWLPSYLVQERHMSLGSMTHLTSSIYLVDAASVLATGWLLDKWIQRGVSASRAYKTALAVSAAGVGTSLLAASVAGPASAVMLLLATGLMDGLNSPSVCALTQRFAGPLATGRWMGVQNAVGNTSGIVAPIVTGQLVQMSGHYTVALWVAGGVALLGLLAWLVLVPRVEPVDWRGGSAAVLAGCGTS